MELDDLIYRPFLFHDSGGGGFDLLHVDLRWINAPHGLVLYLFGF